MSTTPFSPSILSAIPAFATLTSGELEAIAANVERREIRRGEILIREGELPEALYFVASGRFSVLTDRAAEPVAEIGQGQPIGEIGFFGGIPRTATVSALRDSHVLKITRDRLEHVTRSFPSFRDAVIRSLANRLAESNRIEKQPIIPRTIAVVFAGEGPASSHFLEALREVFIARARTLFLTQRALEERFPGSSLDDAEISVWLNSLEVDAEFIFYVADPTPTEWTRKCIRQADLLLLVAAAGAGTGINQCERLACSLHPPGARRLVLVHEARTDVAKGTRSWLRERDVFMHHHVAMQDTADIERLYRFLSGRAVGFVAGGGGAFGSAHLGVYKALREIGADIDFFGGTSVGAAMTAALAAGMDAHRVDNGTHNIFVKHRVFKRYTLPYYALINHKVFDRALKAEYGDTAIEDLWKPFFAVSANLSKKDIMVHRRGPVWEAIRASSSIPGLLPPFFSDRGEMLVDGGIVDTVPLTAMKALKAGPNVIVALPTDTPKTYDVDYHAIPTLREAIIAALNPFKKRKPRQIPSIVQVIILSMTANRRQDLPLTGTDLLMQPKLAPDIHWFSWERHTEVLTCAYRDAVAALRAGLAQADPRVLAVISATKADNRRRLEPPLPGNEQSRYTSSLAQEAPVTP
ncbi:MAG: cyclic nucleotide-binding domain-containing protein [Alphaproteobacteria bacterium]|nr:MAG: cyclic nucleotide-binding domain-containing protein [Alphaproteobacteria bacterium]